MQLHNTRTDRYHEPMIATTPGTMLGRLRASARLAVLVLLVFAMKIGLAAACAKHDFADLGLASDASHQVMVSAAVDTDGNEPGPLPHAGACSHCSCHHASALPNETVLAFAVVPRETVGYRPGVLPSAAPRLELRPPIV